MALLSKSENMRIDRVVKIFVTTSACLLWWHCCFCDSNPVVHENGEIQRNEGTSADLQSGPNDLQKSKKNIKENPEIIDAENHDEDTGQNEAQSDENLVNIVKLTRSENEVEPSEEPDDSEVKIKQHNNVRHAKHVSEMKTHNEPAVESSAQKARLKADVAKNPIQQNVNLLLEKQNLSVSKILASVSPESSSVPQDTLLLDNSITPPLSSAVLEHDSSVLHESIFPSHQNPPESQTKDKTDDSLAVDDEHEGDSVLQHQHPHSEAMPSFDEWKRMMLAEQEKEGLKIPSVPPGKKIASQKRKRNYASYECGAKIVGSNSEAEGTSRILNELVDEYMLNPCKAKIWFVIELCETVQALQIELANFELFSSCPKDFAVYSSDHYPSRDWLLLGNFAATEQRVLQSFELKQEGFGKFIKIELLSYYGKEHYCPLSVVRVFGTSMVDEYEEMETGGNVHSISDDEDRLDVEFNVEDVSPGNIFGSAKDAVINMVKKAAQVLVRDQPAEGENMNLTEHQNMSEEEVCKLFPESSDNCSSPSGTAKDELISDLVPDVLVPFSSFHHALFRYLRNCESCIIPSPDNLTSFQPTCRFFQAALGPVLFKGICNVFRENPLVDVLYNSAFSDMHVIKEDSNTIDKHSTSVSPPPQIISVIIDGAMESKSLPAYSDSIPPSHIPHADIAPSVLLEELSSISVPKVEERSVDQVKVESIQPTKAFQDDTKEEVWGPSSKLAEISPKESDTVESNVVDTVVQPSLADLKITITPTDHTSQPSTAQVSLSPDSSVVSSEVTPLADATGFTLSGKALETEFSLSDGGNDTALKMDAVKPEDSSFTESAVFTPEDFSEVFHSRASGLSDISKEDKESAMMGSVLSVTGGQKESVFMRMSNRIKALELNMSLSSQYLQELSQRYRRQMEEMQRAFNRTIGTLNDTARKASERDVKQQEVINNLQSQVVNLTHAVDLLISERTALYTKMVETHVFLMLVEAIVMITILSLCARRIASNSQNTSSASESVGSVSHPCNPAKRWNSADSLSPSDISKKVRKRSSSGEIPRGDVVIIEPAPILVEAPPTKVKKKSKKKNKSLRRSASNPSLISKNSRYSPTLSKTTFTEEICTAGVLFSACKACKSVPVRPIGKDHRHSYCDENRNVTSCLEHANSNCNKEQTRERRVLATPLQNLTNGIVSHNFCHLDHGDETSDILEVKKINLKKTVKLQKRDSV